VLDALLIGGHPVPAEAIERVVRRRVEVPRGTPWLFWRSRERQSAKVTVITSGGGERSCTLTRDNEQLFFAVPPTTNGWVGGRVLANVGGEFKRLADVSEVRLVEPHGGVASPVLHRVFSRARAEGRVKEVDALLRELLPGLDRVEILTDQDDPGVWLTYEDHAVPSGLAGDGIQSLLRLALELAAAPGGVALIEEPETHEHPGAIRQSAKAIVAAVRRGVQVVVSTHSLELIDALLVELRADEIGKLSLQRLKLVDGVLRTSRLDGEDVSLSRGDIGDDLR
jgi:hypothetical protein